MRFIKVIEINLDAERKDVEREVVAGEGKPVYNKRQQKALLGLIDLVEAEKFEDAYEYIENKKNFPRNLRYEYSEQEHISENLLVVIYGCFYGKMVTENKFKENSRQ